ncbi:MAG TPA: response regulator [Gemmatimonadales bacterium]|nr:response regulator [Gemmatimonadales bacterium]
MSTRRVLLVEDDENDALLTTRALQRAGIELTVDLARDGVEALEYLLPVADASSAARPLPAVVLLDLKLPRVGGLEVLERLRADPRTKLLPIVILTSSTHPRDLASGYGLGCNSYVRKPVDAARFDSIIRQLAMYWVDINQRAEALR